jgi:putative FmdB family regulatory protein
MPTHDFKCPRCKHTQEDWVRNDREVTKCDKCGHIMDKQVSAPNLGGMDKLGRTK